MRSFVLPHAAIAALVFAACNFPAHADDDASGREIETDSIFGFTEGSSIGDVGDKELSLDTEARVGKGGTRYWGSDSKLGFEFTPNRYIQLEFGPFVSAHSIKDVAGLDDREQVAFGGLFGEIKYRLLERTPSLPLALALSAEPEWRRIDETSGDRVDNLGLELKLDGDLELVKDRLYLGGNLLYEPEATHDPDHIGAGWAMESTSGISGALAYRAAPAVVVGAEAWYLRHYDGAWFNDFTGDAVYVGPTLFVQLGAKASIAAAWNVQVHGSEADDPDAKLNQSDFSRQRAKLKLAVEF